MNVRVFGMGGILGGLCLTISEFRHVVMGIPLNGSTMDSFDAALTALWTIGMIGVFWAIYKLGVTGTNKLMRAAPFISLIGFTVGAIFSTLQVFGLVEGNNPAFGVFWILILLGTLIVGILALVARTWDGWRKWIPLLCILAVPIMILLGFIIGEISTILVGLSWTALGYAVLSSDLEASQQLSFYRPEKV